MADKTVVWDDDVTDELAEEIEALDADGKTKADGKDA